MAELAISAAAAMGMTAAGAGAATAAGAGAATIAGAASTVGATALTGAEIAAATAAAGGGLDALGWAAGTTTLAGAAGSAAVPSGLLGSLQTVASVGSMVSTLFGGYMGYRQSKDAELTANINAGSANLAAGQAENEASEKALRIKRELVQKIGSARVAFAGSGVDISSAAGIEAGYGDEASFETKLAKSGGDISAAGQRMQAANYRLQAGAYSSKATSSLVAAAGQAFGTLADTKISLARRG